MFTAFGLTLLHRPYVFILLGFFLFTSCKARGYAKTLLFITWGYLIAWASEALSIRTGIPYGLYQYHPSAFAGELQWLGVPFFDSISYTFMTYAAYMVALRLARRTHWLDLICTTAILTVLLDVIVDPLAVRGNEWFLGSIFHYATPGWYFGVPFSNFAGWFLVALVIGSGYYFIDRWRVASPITFNSRAIREGYLLYFTIGIFNVLITISIGHWELALASTGWLGVVASLFSFLKPRPLPQK